MLCDKIPPIRTKLCYLSQYWGKVAVKIYYLKPIIAQRKHNRMQKCCENHNNVDETNSRPDLINIFTLRKSGLFKHRGNEFKTL